MDTTKKASAPKRDEAAPKPQFLKSLVTPLDERAEMGGILPKMCKCFSYGS